MSNSHLAGGEPWSINLKRSRRLISSSSWREDREGYAPRQRFYSAKIGQESKDANISQRGIRGGKEEEHTRKGYQQRLVRKNKTLRIL